MQATQPKPKRHTMLPAAAVICIASNAYFIYFVHQNSNLYPTTSSIGKLDLPTPSSRQVKAKVPDWHIAVDCSVWDSMCPSSKIMGGRYETYPFPLSRHIKNLTAFDHELISGVPHEWMDALNVDNSIDRDPPRRIVHSDAPSKVSPAKREKCIQDTNELEWKVQIDNLLKSSIKIEPTTNMIAYTISDFNYAFDMMHDVFAMNSDLVGFDGSFFMIALDRDTLEMACDFGYPVVAWPSARPDDSTGLKEAVAFTKFEVSLYLVDKGISFFFYEMDVWFLRSPIELIAEYHSHTNNDILASSHVKDPLSINIGVFSVSANERTKEYFELCLLMGKVSPNTHDQWIMGQLLLMAYIIRTNGKSSMQFTREWKPPPPPEYNPPKMVHPPQLGLYNPMEIMSGAHPYPTKNTIAIHTLTKTPLKKPFGKKMLAKELGAWTGSAGYYSKSGESRRYLMMEGHDHPNSYNLLQSFEYDAMNAESYLFNKESALIWTISVLLALARRTGRIFILPKIIYLDGPYFLWSMLDLESVQQMQIDFRETNFPHNSKSWYSKSKPFRSLARTALAPLTSVDKEGTMYIQLPNNNDIKSWKFNDNVTEATALDTWWALHTAIPEVDSSELLLVNPHFMSAKYAREIQDKMNNKTAHLSTAEKEIIGVYRQLKWCLDNIVNPDNIIGRSAAESACQRT